MNKSSSPIRQVSLSTYDRNSDIECRLCWKVSLRLRPEAVYAGLGVCRGSAFYVNLWLGLQYPAKTRVQGLAISVEPIICSTSHNFLDRPAGRSRSMYPNPNSAYMTTKSDQSCLRINDRIWSVGDLI